MKRRILMFVMAIVLTVPALSACAAAPVAVAPADEGGGQDDGAGKDSSKAEKVSGKKSKKKQKKTDMKMTSLSGSDDVQASDVAFSYENHPCEFSDGEKTLARGNYYTYELDADMAKEYPELDAVLRDYNHFGEEDLMMFFDQNEADILEMLKDREGVYFEDDTFPHLLRSDSLVFSFVDELYVYMGGAHGSTSYTGYNYDPATGKEIRFDDVVSDVSALPDIVVDELGKQNRDLKKYFDELSEDKESLRESLPDRFADNASGIAWGLSYEGLVLCFEDYAMGSYAAGTQIVEIAFNDYPDVFTGKYTQYVKSSDIPDITDVAEDKGDAEVSEIMASTFAPDEGITDPGMPVDITKDMQKKMNVFVSNFVEQGFLSYDYGRDNVEEIATFAYRWTRINKPDDVKIDGSYYKISCDQIKKLADRYLNQTITQDQLNEHVWSGEGEYADGWYYEPAADGESYTGFAVVDNAYDLGNGMLRLESTAYSLDLDTYWDNNETIPKKYYSMTSDEAQKDKTIEAMYNGYAIVKTDGDSYKLNVYE